MAQNMPWAFFYENGTLFDMLSLTFYIVLWYTYILSKNAKGHALWRTEATMDNSHKGGQSDKPDLRRRREEADEFWDLSRLLPPKKKREVPPPSKFVGFVPRTVEFQEEAASAKSAETPTEAKGASPSGTSFPFSYRGETGAPQSTESYHPEGHALITSVTVEKWDTGVSFYRSFRTEAERLYSVKGEPNLPYVPFFSYVPQYSQLTRAQLAYYLSWREGFRQGVYGQIDEAYFRLYVYEIFNLYDCMPREEGLTALCRLWREYRQHLPHVDRYMAQWVIDYCLLYRLPCPMQELQGFFDAILKLTDFPEFYLSEGAQLSPVGVQTLIAAFSEYRWQNRPACKGHEALFGRHIEGALREVFQYLYHNRSALDMARTEKKVFNAFSGSVSAHNIRARLTVHYHPFSSAVNMKNAVTNAVKYTENRIRACVSVRNRLRVDFADRALGEHLIALIDDYCDRCLLPEFITENRSIAAKKPAYERLYDAPKEEFSFENAEKIETNSWVTTRRLTEDVEGEETDALPHFTPLPQTADTQKKSLSSDSFAYREETPTLSQKEGIQTPKEGVLSGASCRYLQAFLEDGALASLRAIADDGVTVDFCVEEINLAFSALYGDVLFIPEGDGYTLIEDYLTEVREWIQTINGFASPSAF